MNLEMEDIYSGYYEDIDILRGISIRCGSSQIVSMIGPNGSGKSTALKTLFGFLKPKRGRILLDGQDVSGMQPFDLLSKGMCYIPQEITGGLFRYLTVRENIELGGWIIRGKGELLRKRMLQTYNKYPVLGSKAGKQALLLSGGEQRMLELGRTSMVEPKIILVDEPSTGLAPIMASQAYKELARMRDDGIGVLLVEQNVRKAIELADYVYVLDLGKVKAEGPREEFETRIFDVVKDWLAF